MLTELTARRLSELRNRATRYELALVVGATAYKLGYSSRPSKMELLRKYRALPESFRDDLVARLGFTDDAPASYTASGGWNFGEGRLRLRKTRRTEREALIEGELPVPGTTF